MKFFTSRIVTKPISLEEAVEKAKNRANVQPRTLDEIIASGKAMKTASSQAEVKTAAVVEPPKTVEVKETKPEIKVAMPMPTKGPIANPVAAKAAEAEQAVLQQAGKPVAPSAKVPVKPAAKAPVAPVAKAPIAASNKHILKIASSLDFRGWEAQAVIDAWGQHKNLEGCVKNVTGSVSDPKTYCSLLSVAASEAPKFVKVAKAENKTEKVASPVYKKIAKLTSKEQGFLKEFFSKIYGQEYVDALLGDY